jgi:hypothetical protein
MPPLQRHWSGAASSVLLREDIEKKLTIHWVRGASMGIVFLLLFLAPFEPEPRFGRLDFTRTTASAERSRQRSSRDSLNIVLAL